MAVLPPIHAFQLDHTLADQVSGRAHRRVMVEVHRTCGEVWYREMLPDHFRESARHTYKHKPRNRRYLRQKELAARGLGSLAKRGVIEMGGRVDNVLTGLFRRSLLDGKTLRIFPTRVTVVMRGPSYAHMRYRMNQPDKPAEVTRVTPGQARRLATAMGRTYRAGIAAERRKATKRFG